MIRLALLFGLVLLLLGCGPTITGPERARVMAIQATYDAEFARAIQKSTVVPSDFGQTLSEIRGALPSASAEVAGYLHLMEGMIHLQTGQIGLARGKSASIAAASDTIGRSDGTLRRDALLAQNFDTMVSGTEAGIRLDALGRDVRTAAMENRIAQSRTLVASAERLERSLCTERRRGRIEAGSEDDGAAFVAALAATFLAQADVGGQFACGNRVLDAELCASMAPDRVFLLEGRDLMATFRSDNAGPQSQIGRQRDEINRRLDGHYGAAGVPAASDACG